MRRILAAALIAAALAASGAANAQPDERGLRTGIILYDAPNYAGEQRDFPDAIPDLSTYRFNDRAQSAVTDGRSWELCEHANFEGRCVRIDRDAPNLAALGLSRRVSSARPLGPAPAPESELRLYGETQLRGQPMRLRDRSGNLQEQGFNDAARSLSADGVWEVCQNSNFGGRCQLVEGDVADLRTIGLSGQISSARPQSQTTSLRGRTAMFFATTATPACSQPRGGQECQQSSADAYCRQQGYRESAYFSVDRRGRVPMLGDVLCIR